MHVPACYVHEYVVCGKWAFVVTMYNIITRAQNPRRVAWYLLHVQAGND